MLLDWIAKLGFLQKDETSGLYMDYPLATRKIIAQQTVGFLLTDSGDFIRNPNYVHTAMEGVGQGFGLPLTDADVIENVIQLYSRWLLNKGRRPSPIEADEETFFRKIFRHMSLIFEPRGSNVDTQFGLCSKTLTILESFGREAGNRISTETWEVLLRVILGSVDLLLKDLSDDANQLSTKLCPLLLRVLFQLWIRSQTMNDTLWKSLGALFVGWRHRGPVIAHWNSLCFAFTNRVIRLLYGPSEGSEVLVVTEADNSSTTYIDMKPEFVYYAWYRILHLIGEPETMTIPNNYLECMKGINTLAETFLNVKGVHAQPPDGNTILHILGPFLFEAINLYDLGALYDRGKSQAFITLLKIFSSKSKVTNFDSRYLASLYRGIEMGLKRNNYIMSVVINNSINLFHCEYRGLRMLVPNYIISIESILSIKNIEGISCKVQMLRNSAIKLLGTFLCLPHHYGSLRFNEGVAYTPEKLGTFWDSQTYLKNLLMEALRTEEDSTNRQMLMWTIVTYLYENIQFNECKDLAPAFITLLLNKIANGQWPLDDNLQTLNVLSEMANLKKFTKDICAQLVLILAAYIESNMEEKKGSSVPESMIVKCLYTILDWIMGDKEQWILNNSACLKAVFRVIEITLTGQKYVPVVKSSEVAENEKKKLTLRAASETNMKRDLKSPYHQPTDKIKNAAGYVLMNILHRLDSFPTPSVGPFSVSSIPNEVEVLEKYGLSPDHISVYIYDRTLLSIIRHKRIDNKIKLTIILRDESGRYLYNSELNYNAYTFNEPTDTDKLLNVPDKNLEPEIDEGLLTTLESWFVPSEKSTQEKLLNCTQTLIQREQNILKSKNYGRDVDIAIKRSSPPDFSEDSKDFTPSRLFLSHLGLGSLVNYENFGVVQKFNSPEAKFNYLQNFSVLDKTRERETYQIGILNKFKGQNVQEMVENQEGSKLFMDFIEQIGWMVNVAEHAGYTGGLDAKVTGQYAPYYATYDFEVIFQVACLMPNKEANTKQIHKTRLINNSKVVIVWADDSEDFKPLPDSYSIVHIVVSPLQSELYQIKVMVRHDSDHTNLPVIGPVLDSMIVSKHILPTVVRNTAINAAKLLREDTTKPYVIRKFMIEDFITRYRVDVPVHSYLASQFTS